MEHNNTLSGELACVNTGYNSSYGPPLLLCCNDLLSWCVLCTIYYIRSTTAVEPLLAVCNSNQQEVILVQGVCQRRRCVSSLRVSQEGKEQECQCNVQLRETNTIFVAPIASRTGSESGGKTVVAYLETMRGKALHPGPSNYCCRVPAQQSATTSNCN